MVEVNRPTGSAATNETQPGAAPMKRVAVACFVGSAIEWYDFVIYGTAAALVFPTVFFPHMSSTMATIASMGTFGAAFLSRPLGAAVFGYLGDRLGRKKTLVISLLIMAVSTVTVGLVPSTAAIGVAAPLILITLRLLQGFAAGGQWAGSTLLSAEYAPANKRGLYGLFTQVGGGSSLTLASLTFLAVNETMGESSRAFMQWGWRLPFLVSAALIVIALYVRLNIDETPVFAAEKVRNFVPEAPFQEVRHLLQHRELALATGSILVASAFFYMASTYFATYAQTHLGYSNSLILYISVLGGLANVAFIALGAVLSDRFGRRRMLLVGWLACLPWSFVAIPLMDTGKPIFYAVAVVGMFAVAAFGWGPAAAFIPELFATRYRYTGAALTANLAGIAGGAVPTLMAGMLLATWGSWAVGLMLAILAVVSLVCTYLLPETLGTAFASQPTPRADVSNGPPELELPGSS